MESANELYREIVEQAPDGVIVREKTVTWFEDCAFSSSDVLSSVFVLPVERNKDRRSRLDTHVRLTP